MGIADDHAALVDEWLRERELDRDAWKRFRETGVYRQYRPSSQDPISLARRDMEKARECGDYAKDSIERGDDDGAKAYAKLAASWGGRVSQRQLEEVHRLDTERKIDSCVYHIEQARATARGLEKDAREAERMGDFEVAKTLSHAALMEWRRLELYQQELLDLTRE